MRTLLEHGRRPTADRPMMATRMAAVLFAGSGAIALLSLPLPVPGLRPIGTATVGACACGLGVIVWCAPWDRWPPSTSISLAPLALIVIALGDVFGGHDPYEYGLYFIAVFVWVGVAHRRWTSLWIFPFAVAAYVTPLIIAGGAARSAIPTVAIVMPLGVLVGETISWVVSRLDSTERDNAELEQALAEKSKALERLYSLEVELRDSEERHRTLVEEFPVVTYVDAANPERSTLYISPQVESLLGYPPADWLEDPELWIRILHPDDADRVLDARRRSNQRGTKFHTEYRMCASDGRTVWVRHDAVLVGSGESSVWQGILLDITDRKRAQEELEFLAYHDPLTGLANRGLLEEHLDLALARAKRSKGHLGVLSIDLDRFKLVNDMLGHDAGDEFLRAVARRIRESVREVDLVARIGGDEFVVLLPDLQPEADGANAVVALVDRLRLRIHEAIEQPLIIADTELRPTASMGSAIFPIDTPDERELMRDADRQMYRAKRLDGPAGNGHRSTAARAPSIQQRLRAAAEGGDWALCFQPIRELVCGRLVGAETLLRCRDPVVSELGPEVFVPMAEQLGLMPEMGRWIIGELESICRGWASSDALDPLANLSLNVSPGELWHPDLIERLGRLRRAMPDSHTPIIELTESTLGMDYDRAAEMIGAVRDVGFRVALDDFGTGYSSLSRLRSLPIDVVKIDRAFIQEVARDDQAAHVVRSLIQLIAGLGMVPLAEGIESADVVDYLRSNGCPLGQGFLLGRPMTADRLARLACEDAAHPADLAKAPG
jgi:diguanylate cyclase (GGDEF)-like protein/PAS domain S-box-containing protein